MRRGLLLLSALLLLDLLLRSRGRSAHDLFLDGRASRGNALSNGLIGVLGLLFLFSGLGVVLLLRRGRFLFLRGLRGQGRARHLLLHRRGSVTDSFGRRGGCTRQRFLGTLHVGLGALGLFLALFTPLVLRMLSLLRAHLLLF